MAEYAWFSLYAMGELAVVEKFNHKVTRLLRVWKNKATVDSKLNVQSCMYSEAVKTKAGLLKMATDMWGVGKMESMMLSDVLRSELKQKVLLNIECF